MTANSSICAYCGVASPFLTRDHVVARAFWKDGLPPPNPITVPACEQCQQYWDAETTYFRNILVIQSDAQAHPAINRLALGPIKRRIEKSAPDLFDLTRNAVRAWKQSESGLLVEPRVRIDIDLKRLLRTPEKIIRGFFFVRNGIPLPSSYDVRVFPGNGFWSDAGFQNLLETMHEWQGLGDDVFQLRAARDSSDPNITAWLLLFFRSSALFGYSCQTSVEVEKGTS